MFENKKKYLAAVEIFGQEFVDRLERDQGKMKEAKHVISMKIAPEAKKVIKKNPFFEPPAIHKNGRLTYAGEFFDRSQDVS